MDAVPASTSELVRAIEGVWGRRLPPDERRSVETKLGKRIEQELCRVSGGWTAPGKPDIVVDGVGAFEVCLSHNSKSSKGHRGDVALLADYSHSWLVQCFGRVRSQNNGGIETLTPYQFLNMFELPSDTWPAILRRVVDDISALQQPLFEIPEQPVARVERYNGGLLLRYPGSKRWLSSAVLAVAYELGIQRVVEPFVGAGGMAIALMREGLLVSASDANRPLCALWNCVRDRPAELAQAVSAFTPTLDAFFTLRAQLLEDSITDELQAALAKLVVHQMGYGTLGEMSGGPIGGRQQEGKKYQMDARWIASSLIRRVYSFHDLFGKQLDGRVRNVDFTEVIDDRPGLMYLDPPYYGPGAGLYHSKTDHVKLRDYLGKQQRPWILSYDDTPEVRALYQEFPYVEVLTRPKVTSPASGRPPQRELVVTNNERTFAVLEDWAADWSMQ